jgi:HSP20 family protein
MSASEKDYQPDQESQQDHYHVVGHGAQLFVVRHSHVWRPATDVMADEDRLIVIVEAAGMKDGEFHVTFGNQQLTITGTRPPREQAHAAYYQLEVRFGEFRTDISLPWQINEDEIVAQYEDGFLRIELPRARPQKIRAVNVHKIDSE